MNYSRANSLVVNRNLRGPKKRGSFKPQAAGSIPAWRILSVFTGVFYLIFATVAHAEEESACVKRFRESLLCHGLTSMGKQLNKEGTAILYEILIAMGILIAVLVIVPAGIFMIKRFMR